MLIFSQSQGSSAVNHPQALLSRSFGGPQKLDTVGTAHWSLDPRPRPKEWEARGWKRETTDYRHCEMRERQVEGPKGRGGKAKMGGKSGPQRRCLALRGGPSTGLAAHTLQPQGCQAEGSGGAPSFKGDLRWSQSTSPGWR